MALALGLPGEGSAPRPIPGARNQTLDLGKNRENYLPSPSPSTRTATVLKPSAGWKAVSSSSLVILSEGAAFHMAACFVKRMKGREAETVGKTKVAAVLWNLTLEVTFHHFYGIPFFRS